MKKHKNSERSSIKEVQLREELLEEFEFQLEDAEEIFLENTSAFDFEVEIEDPFGDSF